MKIQLEINDDAYSFLVENSPERELPEKYISKLFEAFIYILKEANETDGLLRCSNNKN